MVAVLDGYSTTATPDELRRFADIMQSGSDREQKAAVDQAGNIGLAYMAAHRVGG
jgi:hypothetical protein